MAPEIIVIPSDSDSSFESDARPDASDMPSQEPPTPANQKPKVPRQNSTIEVHIRAAPAKPRASSPSRARDGEIPFTQSSGGGRGDGDEEEEVFKTPIETPGRRIVFADNEDEDDDGQHFVTPMEEVPVNPLALAVVGGRGASGDGEDKEDDEDDDDDNSDDSDDDAPPEAVSTRAAHAQTKRVADAVAKAAEQQAAEHKRRRQERDAFFRQQATEKKRMQQKAAAVAAEREQRAQLHDLSNPAVAGPPFHPGGAEASAAHVSTASSASKFLPAELLESDDDGDKGRRRPKNKKIKFVDEADGDDGTGQPGRGGGAIGSVEAAQRWKRAAAEAAERKRQKPARDQTVGTSVYRVMKARARTELAPRMAKDSRHLKHQMQMRGRVQQRRPGAAFLVRR